MLVSLCLLVILLHPNPRGYLLILAAHGNRWKGCPIGFGIVVKGLLKGRFMRKKSQLHHNLEAGRAEVIVKIVIIGMGMSNYQRIITQL